MRPSPWHKNIYLHHFIIRKHWHDLGRRNPTTREEDGVTSISIPSKWYIFCWLWDAPTSVQAKIWTLPTFLGNNQGPCMGSSVGTCFLLHNSIVLLCLGQFTIIVTTLIIFVIPYIPVKSFPYISMWCSSTRMYTGTILAVSVHVDTSSSDGVGPLSNTVINTKLHISMS